jgi:hypothetical protein
MPMTHPCSYSRWSTQFSFSIYLFVQWGDSEVLGIHSISGVIVRVRIVDEGWSIGSMIMDKGNRSTRRKCCSHVTLSTTNPTLTAPRFNPDLRIEATNHVHHGILSGIFLAILMWYIMLNHSKLPITPSTIRSEILYRVSQEERSIY